MIGSTDKITAKQYRDEITGVTVTRLTPESADYHHLYFTNHSFTADGKSLVIGSNRDQGWQLYSLEIDTGKLCGLTDSPLSTHSTCLDPVKRVAYYFADGVLHSVKIDTLEHNEHYRVPDGFKPGTLSVSSCGRYLAFPYQEIISSSTSSGRIYSGMHEYYFQHPRCLVVRLELETGRPSAIWGETNWISHVQISPVDPNIVMFCHEGAFLVKQRMWIVNSKTSVCKPLYDQQPNEHCAHEYFLKDGRVVSQLAVYPNEDKPFSGNSSINYHIVTRVDNTEQQKFSLPSIAPFHIQSNSDASLHVGDTAFPTKDYPNGGKMMSLLRHVEDRVEVQPFCRHGGDFTMQLGHQHPIFSPDDRHVLFTSNAGGKCGVYLADVPT